MKNALLFSYLIQNNYAQKSSYFLYGLFAIAHWSLVGIMSPLSLASDFAVVTIVAHTRARINGLKCPSQTSTMVPVSSGSLPRFSESLKSLAVALDLAGHMISWYVFQLCVRQSLLQYLTDLQFLQYIGFVLGQYFNTKSRRSLSMVEKVSMKYSCGESRDWAQWSHDWMVVL